MHIVAHLGHDDKSYEFAVAGFWPERCVTCGGLALGRHDGYERWGLDNRIEIQRFLCYEQGCRQVWSVLPSYLTRFQMYATAVETAAVLRYVLQGKTYAQAAAESGVSLTTAFRWVAEGAAGAVLTLLHVARTLMEFTQEQMVHMEPEPADRIRATEWQLRRVREAKIPRLLELCVLVRCLEVFVAAFRPAWPAAKAVPGWGLWRWACYPICKWQTIHSTTNGKSRSSPQCYAGAGGGHDDPGEPKPVCTAKVRHDRRPGGPSAGAG